MSKNIEQLIIYLHDKFLSMGEVPDQDTICRMVSDFENGDEDSVSYQDCWEAGDVAAHRFVDSMVANALQTPEWDEKERNEYIEIYERMRPAPSISDLRNLERLEKIITTTKRELEEEKKRLVRRFMPYRPGQRILDNRGKPCVFVEADSVFFTTSLNYAWRVKVHPLKKDGTPAVRTDEFVLRVKPTHSES